MTDSSPDDQTTEPELTGSALMNAVIRTKPGKWDPFAKYRTATATENTETEESA